MHIFVVNSMPPDGRQNDDQIQATHMIGTGTWLVDNNQTF